MSRNCLKKLICFSCKIFNVLSETFEDPSTCFCGEWLSYFFSISSKFVWFSKSFRLYSKNLIYFAFHLTVLIFFFRLVKIFTQRTINLIIIFILKFIFTVYNIAKFTWANFNIVYKNHCLILTDLVERFPFNSPISYLGSVSSFDKLFRFSKFQIW